MDSLEIRQVDVVNLPDLAIPCLKSGTLQTGVTVPREEAEKLSRRKLSFFHDRRECGSGAQIAYVGKNPVGILEYCPIEVSPVPVRGEGLFVILCMQVTAQSRVQEIEKGLVAAALDDWSSRRGVVVLGDDRDWGEHGFESVCTEFWPDGRDLTLWMLKFWDADEPTLVPLGVKGVSTGNGTLVQIFDPGCCPWVTYVADRVREVAAELGPRVVVENIDCAVRDNVLEYGISAGIAVNGRIQKWTSPHPVPSREEIRDKIELYL